MCLLAAGGAAFADRHGGRGRDRDDDQERVWEARRKGDILPLETILDRALTTVPGEVLEIDLDDDKDGLVYEIKILTRRGLVLELDIDAHSGKILELEEDD
jgi:uncharacterized membrane protein YkoI